MSGTPNETFKLALRQRHLEQLRAVDIPPQDFPGLPKKGPNYDNLVKWLDQAKDQIAKAIAARECWFISVQFVSLSMAQRSCTCPGVWCWSRGCWPAVSLSHERVCWLAHLNCAHSEDIDWNIALFALLESAATYLR